MKNQSFFPIVDRGRESWLFLMFDKRPDAGEASWAAGVGHINRVLEQWHVDWCGEREALLSLCELLGEYQYQDILLVTVDAQSLRELRSWLLDSEVIDTPTLRGYRHLSVEELFTEYFAGDDVPSELHCSETVGEDEIKSLCSVFSSLVPLVPISHLSGTEL